MSLIQSTRPPPPLREPTALPRGRSLHSLRTSGIKPKESFENVTVAKYLGTTATDQDDTDLHEEIKIKRDFRLSWLRM
jgi:hypothetical protein